MLVLLLVEVTVIIIGDRWNYPLAVIVLLFTLLLVILTVLGTFIVRAVCPPLANESRCC